MKVTRDGFLDKRVLADQPKDGFRAGHDSVLLAAAVPAQPKQRVLELGSGAGIASLCLAARTPCRVLGLEIDPELVELANANAALNTMSDRVRFEVGDAATGTPGGAPFDHVFFNPPFHPDSGQVSKSKPKDRAKRDVDDALVTWTLQALRLLRPRGTVTIILRADRLNDWLECVEAGIVVLPFLPKAAEVPKRVIVQVRPMRPGMTILDPIVLHEADGKPTADAEAVLRGGAALVLP